jgi:chromosome partitioning protein
MGKTIFIGARKGGVGKTMTAASLGVGLARQGKKTLLIDADSQHSLTASLGIKEPDKLKVTFASVMNDLINEEAADPTAGIIHHSEGVDLLLANSRLTGFEPVAISAIEYFKSIKSTEIKKNKLNAKIWMFTVHVVYRIHSVSGYGNGYRRNV